MSEYSVDLSALNQVINRLNSLVRDMDGIGTTAEYKTEIPEGYLGQGFEEEVALRRAHGLMKASIAGMVTELRDMIADAGQKTSKVHSGYDGQEQDIGNSMR